MTTFGVAENNPEHDRLTGHNCRCCDRGTLEPDGVHPACSQAGQQYGYAAGAAGQPRAQQQVTPCPDHLCRSAWWPGRDYLPAAYDVANLARHLQAQYGSYQQQQTAPAPAATQQQQYAATSYGSTNATTHGGAQQVSCLLISKANTKKLIRSCTCP